MAEVRLEVEIPHPPVRVWRALTDPELLGDWFMVAAGLQPRAGSRFQLDPGPLPGFRGPITGEIIEAMAPRRLAMRWQGDDLHARVLWELHPVAGGCVLRVRQTGFFGAPAAARRRELREVYAGLFTERLLRTLDRLATGQVAPETPSDAAAGGATPVTALVTWEPELRLAVPRQRRPGADAVAAATPSDETASAASGSGPPDPSRRGRTAGLTVGADPAAPEDGRADPWLPAADGPAVSRGAGIPRPREAVAGAAVGTSVRAPAGVPGSDPAVAGRRRPASAAAVAAWRRWLTVAPAWARFVATGTAAAVLALAVLAALAPGTDPWRDGVAPGEVPGRAGPGQAVQPGATTPGSPSGHGSAGEPGRSAGAAEPPAETGVPSRVPTPPATPPAGGGEASVPASASPTPAPPVTPPELTAQVSHSTYGLLGLLGGRRVTVTVDNPGPGTASGWTVAMDVGSQDVQNVTGAAYERDGSVAVFTAAEPELDEGDNHTFSFDIPSTGLLGLGGTDAPTDCTIDGRTCE